MAPNSLLVKKKDRDLVKTTYASLCGAEGAREHEVFPHAATACFSSEAEVAEEFQSAAEAANAQQIKRTQISRTQVKAKHSSVQILLTLWCYQEMGCGDLRILRSEPVSLVGAAVHNKRDSVSNKMEG